MSGWQSHLILLPVVLPLLAGAVMLLLDGRSRSLKAAINLSATVALVVAAIMLLRLASMAGSELDSRPAVYLLGNWPAPFGIVLVLDQLSALMLMLTSILALASLVFSLARWHRAGVHFHPLFQFLLMGMNGAFLTGDLFNLFVFFEVMLAASYGLVLHGSGISRVHAGLHYIVVNLAAASLFLIGVSLLYSVTGTLNMADLATRVSRVDPDDRMILEAGAAILGVAFLVKAGMWPLSFWLPPAYTAACPPVAAIFTIMSKVGVYVLLRLWLLLFGDGESARFGEDWLLYGGMMTIAFGMIGVLASQDTARLAGFAVLVSSGTLLAAIGTNQVAVTASALFYLVSSTLAIGAFFMLIELLERGREIGADMLAVTREAFGDTDEGEPQEEEEVGVPLPATMAMLSVSFLSCAVLLAGLPPLSGFVAKFALLSGLFSSGGPGASDFVSAANWAFITLLIVSSLSALIAMTRAGIRTFWDPIEREVPRIGVIEIAPIAGLLLLCATLTVEAGPVMRYMQATAQFLHDPAPYVQGVLAAPRTQPDRRTDNQ